MKPFKYAYQIATAGALVAAAAGAGGALLYSQYRRISGRRPVSPTTLGVCSAAAGAAFALLYYPPYCHRKSFKNSVYLTFDDGPDPQATPLILDALKAAGAHATFFVLGEAVDRHSGILRRIVSEGHTVGIHGYHHAAITLRSPRHIGHEIDLALNAIHSADADAHAWLFRPPFGLRGPGLRWALEHRGLRLKLWTLDSHDYLLRSAVQVRERLADAMQAGDIVVLHDAGETGIATAAALPGILEDIRRQGWKCEGL